MTTEDKILEAIKELKQVTLLGVKEVLDVNDLAALTGLSQARIHRLTSQRLIPYYKPNGGKLFFKKSEVNAWLLRNRQDSVSDINSEAVTHVVLERVSGKKRNTVRRASTGV